MSVMSGMPNGVMIREQVADDGAAVHELIALAFGRGMVADLDAALGEHGERHTSRPPRKTWWATCD